MNDLFELESKGAQGFIFRQVSKFLIDLPNHVEEIKKAIEKSNFEVIEHHSHKINGFSGTIGALRIRDIAILIEKKSIERKISQLPDLFETLEKEILLSSKELRDVADLSKNGMTSKVSKGSN